VPLLQVAVALGGVWQTAPQAPQWFRSVLVLTQLPLHSVWPLGQAQWLPEQIWPPVQALPQLPQLPGLLVRSTQAPPQLVSPCGQQAPCEQTAPVPQLAPQAPQWSLSLWRLTHAPPQQLGALLEQPLLQEPQWLAVVRSVHAPPQQPWPLAQT
jgi:hypothetical protein